MNHPPQLIVRNKAHQDMVHQTLKYANIETAWAIYGFILPRNKIYLAGIIQPLEDEIRRSQGDVELIPKRINDAYSWLEKYAHNTGIKPEVARFTYLGTGHSHYKLGLSEYSGTDVQSICRKIISDGWEVSVGPLANIRGEKADKVEFKFYFYSRQMWQAGIERPILLRNFRLEKSLPKRDRPRIEIPLLGWQFFRRDMYGREISEIKNSGYQITIQENMPPTISFTIKKPDWRGGMITICTEYNFPDSPPIIEVFPNDGRDVVDASRFWEKKRLLAEVVRKIESSNFFNGGKLPEK